MRRLCSYLAVGLLVGALSCAAPAGPPLLDADPASLGFGTTTPATPVVRSVTLTNVGESDVQVDAALITGDGAAAWETPSVSDDLIAIGGSLTVEVTFAPATEGAYSAVLELRLTSGTLVTGGPNCGGGGLESGLATVDLDGIAEALVGGDSDFDGLPDPVEVTVGTDPEDADSDDDCSTASTPTPTTTACSTAPSSASSKPT
ncbi:MAG: choice-of-anchor D domain-containing protein [Proteobacteria bacterium]|nr:choice-of-anchor D domain-containing protein [Pseudomonadota bacterium]